MWWAEKHHSMNKTSKLEVNEVRQQKITLGSAPVSQKQKSETIMGTNSPKHLAISVKNWKSVVC